MTKRIVGEIGFRGRRKLRKFIKQQKKTMFMLDISVNEDWHLFSSVFDIEVSGEEPMVYYWCKVIQIYLNRL